MSSSSRSSATDRWLAGLACVVALLASTTVMAQEPPSYVTRYVADARLAGSGTLTWWGFHVYDARLYVQRPLDLRDPTAQPFVLEIRYARSLKGTSIAEASGEEIARLGFGTDAQRERWDARMQQLFPDVRAGDRLAGVNLPGGGVRFYFDGRFIGAIDDPEFARAFFAIWLDARTQAPKLREALLRGGSSTGST